jgi:hypothetical protein
MRPLNGYRAKQCPRRVHNDYHPSRPKAADPDEAFQALLDGGAEFERKVNKAFSSAVPNAVVVPPYEDWNDTIAHTLRAMDADAPVVINGRLPSVNDRSGAPDVLLRVAPNKYLPVDIKWHLTTKPLLSDKKSIRVSTLANPTSHVSVPGYSVATTARRGDSLQLAHYTRMLQDLGYHPTAPGIALDDLLIGGIIGSDDFTDLLGAHFAITWYDLTAPTEQTYSKAGGKSGKKRSIMAVYDHEHIFRRQVALDASCGVTTVVPFHKDECKTCPFLAVCKSQVGKNDPSFAMKIGLLSDREWRYLYDNGGDTLEGLASLNADDLIEIFEGLAPGTTKPMVRLQNVIRRARMLRDEVLIEPKSGPDGAWPLPPTADVEIDFDIEWTEEGIYQWGLRIRHNQDEATAIYEPIVSFESPTPELENQLAVIFYNRLKEIVDGAETADKTVAIYHWSHPEISQTRKFFPELTELIAEHHVDLIKYVDEFFFSLHGNSIKKIAPAFGFAWDCDDAGGAMSIAKAKEAQAGCQEAAAWLLSYNGDDVKAQAVIRDGIAAEYARRQSRHAA